MAMQQELADLSAEVKELRREASSIANATEQTLNELLQHMEALQKVQTDARDARSQTLRPPVSLGGPGIPGRSSRMNVGQRPRPQALDVPSDGPWKSRFENFILKQREQAERLAAASSDTCTCLESHLFSSPVFDLPSIQGSSNNKVGESTIFCEIYMGTIHTFNRQLEQLQG